MRDVDLLKISLITLLEKNYGCLLQAFASQEKFKELGCEFEFINFIRRRSQSFRLLLEWGKANPVKMGVLLPSYLRWISVMQTFKRNYLQLSPVFYESEEALTGYPLDADIYCTGSDQVWNSSLLKGVEYPFYLSFIPSGKRKISFAASFGKNSVSELDVEQTKELIHQYECISVRENSGIKILKEQYAYTRAIQIVDPTLTLPPEFWRGYAPKNKIKQPYILIYTLNKYDGLDDYVRKLSNKTGLCLVRLCTQYHQALKIGKSILIPDIFEFITLIDNADYTLTDSFHATAFSMALNTEPICIGRNNSRVRDLLQMLESQHRSIKNFQDLEALNQPSDFARINEILKREREKADKFLKNIIHNGAVL